MVIKMNGCEKKEIPWVAGISLQQHSRQLRFVFSKRNPGALEALRNGSTPEDREVEQLETDEIRHVHNNEVLERPGSQVSEVRRNGTHPGLREAVLQEREPCFAALAKEVLSVTYLNLLDLLPPLPNLSLLVLQRPVRKFRHDMRVAERTHLSAETTSPRFPGSFHSHHVTGGT